MPAVKHRKSLHGIDNSGTGLLVVHRHPRIFTETSRCVRHLRLSSRTPQMIESQVFGRQLDPAYLNSPCYLWMNLSESPCISFVAPIPLSSQCVHDSVLKIFSRLLPRRFTQGINNVQLHVPHGLCLLTWRCLRPCPICTSTSSKATQRLCDN